MLRRLFSTIVIVALASGTPVSAQAEGFSGAGSTFAHPILARWAREFATLQGEGGAHVSVDRLLDYEPVGSLGGVMRVLQGGVDFGVTEVPLPPEELARHGIAQFPFVTGGIAVVVNLRGVANGMLRLSGPVLARIYMGEILRWSDPAIGALNPGLALPDAAITVLRRLDGSGTTYHFAAYLAGASPEWNARVGVGTLLNWPTGIAANGNRELAERVRAIDNAIGYVEASQAARLRLPVALIANRAGHFVAPNLASVRAASALASGNPDGHFHQGPLEPTGETAYPIVATAYALVPRRPASPVRARLALEFFRMGLTERSADAVALGYAPLSEPLIGQVTAYWSATIGADR